MPEQRSVIRPVLLGTILQAGLASAHCPLSSEGALEVRLVGEDVEVSQPTHSDLQECLASLSDLNPLSVTLFDLRPGDQQDKAWIPGALRPRRAELAAVARQVRGDIVLVGDGADDVDLLVQCVLLNREGSTRVRLLPGGLRQLVSAGWTVQRRQGAASDESLLPPTRLLALLDSGIARFLPVTFGSPERPTTAAREIESLLARDNAPDWPSPVLDRLRPTVFLLPDHDPVGSWSQRLGVSATDHVLFYNGGLDALRQTRRLHGEIERGRQAPPPSPCDRLG